jgi:hypothetical protein
MKRKGRKPTLRLSATPLPAEAISKSAFARLLKCAPARVTEWIAKRVLAPPAVTASGSIVPSLAVEQLLAAGAVLPRSGVPADHPVPDGATVNGNGHGYDHHRSAHEALRVELAGLELAERRGTTVSKALSDHVLFDCLRGVRDTFQGMPARVAAVMAARLGVDAGRLLAELEAAVRDQLMELSDVRADWRVRSAASWAGSVE